MAFWTFPSDSQSWTPPEAWTGLEGNPAGSIGGGTITGLSIPITEGAPISFWGKIMADEDDTLGEVTLELQSFGSAGTTFSASRTIASLPYDSGWFKVETTLSAGEITGIQLSAFHEAPEASFSAFFDTVYVAEAEPEAGGATLYYGVNNIPSSVPIVVT